MTTPRRALIVIDVQNEYVTGDLPIEYPPVDVSLANIGRAIDAAQAASVPVVVVQNLAPATSPIFATGSEGAALHDVVASRKHDHEITKSLPSAFTGTDLADWLAQHQIDTLTVTGYMTHNCDASTINHAVHAGLAVEFLHDATGSVPYANSAGFASAEDIHRVFCVVLQSRFAAVASTDQWIDALSAGKPLERDSIYASNQKARTMQASAAAMV
ncbi:cysteine hydrolase family protein [Paraburkholderia saeva]|uniref:Peroxyureidoacrylate/ureidoacrylate amidohydrolase RutB n=1 Tax=Paraburkholderia saeva TaxID=2777537 RepID=A0A9N8RUH5_9BURK|nr:cysteine hydrolase family protein [Paraburkholderia saeva]CAG4890502.1 Peroxyureidoacrylate/ureidoacrylate amidohydrolase RutB [Paraburkholderia saeva]CAG4914709.1 Peroxyureidoacrylate/ureidoacrylate amidohydrolase RutB [Paraburkholderia saeva]